MRAATALGPAVGEPAPALAGAAPRAQTVAAREERDSSPRLGWLAVAVAAALAASPLAHGYFAFEAWGALALGALTVLVVLLRAGRAALTRPGAIASAGLGGLLALSAASMLWAESEEAAWTSVNRLVLYGAVFAIVVLAVRELRTARLIVTILGAAALVASLWVCASMLAGSAHGAFLGRRLNAPLGYINGTAGLLVMGLWPLLAWAESARDRGARVAALGAASLVAGTFVLTQSRAVIPATIVAAGFALACARGRATRSVNLTVVVASVAAGLPWTLRVYTAGGVAEHSAAPGAGVLRAAALALLASALGAVLVRLALSRWAAAPAARRAPRLDRRAGVGLALASLAAIGVAAAVAAPWIGRQYRSFTSLRVNDTASVRFLDAGGFRYDLWRVAVRELEAHPIGGVGAGNYDVEYYRLRHNPEYVIQPHSLELQMAAELGVGGLVALLLFCGAIAWAACAGAGTLASQDRLVRVAATGMFFAWLLSTSVDWLYDIPGLTGMAFVAAALLVVPAGVGRRPAPPMRRRMVLALALLAVALAAASVGRQYVADRYARAGAGEIARSPQAAIADLDRARRLDPHSLSTLYALAAAYARRDDYAHAAGALLAAERREPHNYVPPALLGDLALRRGDLPLAGRQYSRALALNPHDPAVSDALREVAAEAR